MENELIVRIFVHGLLLLAPDYSSANHDGTEMKSLELLLVDARNGEHGLAPHRPMVVYCKRPTGPGKYCATAVEAVLAEELDFEHLTVFWKETAAPAPSVIRRVKLNNDAGNVAKVFPKPPPSDASRPAEASDFDWILSLATILGEARPLPVKASCYKDKPYEKGCDIVARVSFSDGDVSSCEFVAAPEKGGWVVPSLAMVAPGKDLRRAAANIVMIELSRPLAEVEALVIEKLSGGPLMIGPNGDVPDSCSGPDFCADLSITNLPPASRWDAEGKHFRVFYDLVETPAGTLLHPYPMVLWDTASLPPHKVHRKCPMPEAFYKVAGLQPGRKGPFSFLFDDGSGGPLPYVENRPICPPGTP